MSLQAKIESAGSMNFCLWRHGSAGGAWRVASFEPNSHNCHGSPKDALTSLASFLESSFPGTADSSIHRSGILHLSTFYGTHWLNSTTGGSGDVSLPSSSEVFSDPLRKEATVGFSSSGSSRSEPLPLDPCSLGSVLGVGRAAWGRLILKPDFVALLLLALSTLSSVIPALGSGPWLWVGPSMAQPLYFLFQGRYCGQCFLMGLTHHGQTSLHWVIFPCSVGDMAPRGMGAFSMGSCCGCGGLFFLTPLVVW